MKNYIRNTLIQGIAIGTVVWLLYAALRSDNPLTLFNWIWDCAAFIIAIIGVDFVKHQKVFARKN